MIYNIQKCRSVTVSHKMKWIQHFHPALDTLPNSPTQNMVELQTKGWDEVCRPFVRTRVPRAC